MIVREPVHRLYISFGLCITHGLAIYVAASFIFRTLESCLPAYALFIHNTYTGLHRKPFLFVVAILPLVVGHVAGEQRQVHKPVMVAVYAGRWLHGMQGQQCVP